MTRNEEMLRARSQRFERQTQQPPASDNHKSTSSNPSKTTSIPPPVTVRSSHQKNASSIHTSSTSSWWSMTMNDDLTESPEPVNSAIAYFLLFFFGTWGLHHAYLGRYQHALLHACTFGLCGWGLLWDLFCFPEYLALANAQSHDVTFQRWQRIKKEIYLGIPPLSIWRLVGMTVFGKAFGSLGSCLIPPTGTLWIMMVPKLFVEVLTRGARAMGAAAGIALVANVGSVTIHRPFRQVVLACAAGSMINYPVLSGVLFCHYYRAYRPSLVPRGKLPRRFGKYLLLGSVLVGTLLLATFVQFGITFEVVSNVRHSNFFQEFDFKEFKGGNFHYQSDGAGAGAGSGGGQQPGGGRSEYLWNALDLNGERAARRTLGVSRKAEWSDIKAAHKKLALQHHPDKIGREASEEEREVAKTQFMKVQDAYETLKNINERNMAQEQQRARQGAGRREF